MPCIWLALIIIAYAMMQYFTLGTRSFNGDEGVILNVVSQNNWHGFWLKIASDVHPPLYHILAKALVSIFGLNEWSLRLPAMLAGAGIIILSFVFGKIIWADNKRSLYLSILFGFTPYLFYYHQEARFYSLLLCFAVLSYIGILKLSQKVCWQNWLIYAIAAVGLVYTQHLGWIILFLEFLAILWQKDKKLTKAIIIAWSITLLLYLPFVTIFDGQLIGRLAEQGNWAIGQDISGILGVIYRFGAGRLILGISLAELIAGGWWKIYMFAITLIIPLLFVVLGLSVFKRNLILLKLAWIIIIGSIVVALFYPEIGGRTARYLIYLWPFYGLVLVEGIGAVWRSLAGKLAVVLLILILLCGLVQHIMIENYAAGAKDIAKVLNIVTRKDNAILVRGALAGGETAVLNYYFANPQNATIIDYNASYKPGNIDKIPALADQLHQILEYHHTIWYYDFTYSDVDFGLDFFADGVFVGYDKENMPIYVYRFTFQ